MNNPSLFWKELRELGGERKTGISDKISVDDWLEHFKSVFELINADGDDDANVNIVGNDLEDEENHVLNRPITEEEIRQAIRKLNCGKACGIDEIKAEMLKAGGQEVISFLVKLFNHVFDRGIYPGEWANAIIVPIFKKGDTDRADNYRGVSLISEVCKCYTSILNTRLYTWLAESDTIVENQAGFRKNYSTTDQIFSLYAVIQKCLNQKKQM